MKITAIKVKIFSTPYLFCSKSFCSLVFLNKFNKKPTGVIPVGWGNYVGRKKTISILIMLVGVDTNNGMLVLQLQLHYSFRTHI